MSALWLSALGRNWLTLHGLVVVTGLAIYVLASRALYQRRHPSAAIAWVVMLALLPYVALPLYFMFGSRKVANSQRLNLAGPTVVRSNRVDDLAAWSRRLAGAMGLPDACAYEALSIHRDGTEALQALRDVIASATTSIDVCTFVFSGDALGREVAALLMRRARSGVRVRVLLDGFGVFLSRHFKLRSLRAAGVEVVKFVPALNSAVRGLNLRNHRKLVLADGERLWTGGRNLASEYFEGEAKQAKPAWHDLTFDLRGALACQAQRRFDLDWEYAERKVKGLPARKLVASTPPAAPCGSNDGGANPDPPLAQLIPSGPDQIDDTVQALLVSGAFMAQERILAVTPYFVPDATLLMALTLAARRGVAVDLVIPARSNHRLADVARNRPLRDLSRAGARIWLTRDMVHAKAIVIDDGIALVGSANLDARSLFLNYELMTAFYVEADVKRFAAWIELERASAQAYRAKAPGLLRDLAEGLVLWLAFQL